MSDIRTNNIYADIVILHQENIVQLSWRSYVTRGRVLKAFMLRY